MVGISIIFCFKQKTAYDVRMMDWSSVVCSSDPLIGRPVTTTGFGLARAAETAAVQPAGPEPRISRRQCLEVLMYTRGRNETCLEPVETTALRATLRDH